MDLIHLETLQRARELPAASLRLLRSPASCDRQTLGSDGVQGLCAVTRGLRASYLDSIKVHHLDTSVYPSTISGRLVTLLSRFHNAKSVMIALLEPALNTRYTGAVSDGDTRTRLTSSILLPLTLQHGYT